MNKKSNDQPILVFKTSILYKFYYTFYFKEGEVHFCSYSYFTADVLNGKVFYSYFPLKFYFQYNFNQKSTTGN